LPNEFEEEDLRTFLSQFGRVENSRISRSIKSGNSRGYAFVKFTDPETAKVVAETMQGYFLGKRRLVCHLVPNPDDGMFYDTDKLIVRRKSLLETEKKRREQNLASADKMKEITSRLMKRERKKRKKLEELGIDYDFPGYQANTNQDEEETQEAKESSSKKKKRKDSIGSVGSAGSRSSRKRKDSISSATSEISKRLDSVGSERNATPVKKRKDSIGSVVSAGSNKSKRKNSEEEEIPKMVPQSEQKKKTKRKSKRRLSRP
jgi:nucleolar protein 15